MAAAADDNVRIAAWLRDRGVSATCPSCGNGTWVVGSPVLLRPAAGDDDGFPVVPVLCPRCAHVRLFAAPGGE